jgi:flagellar protein FlgJ
MDISSISPIATQGVDWRSNAQAAQIESGNPAKAADSPDKAAKTAKQFEAILLRQILTESMGSLLQGGESGQVYGYLITDALADSMSKAGGLGLSHILEAQFKQ